LVRHVTGTSPQAKG